MRTDAAEEGKKKLSKRQRKMLNQLKIAELKQLAERPDVVEVWDVTSPDPQMLVYLKVGARGMAGPVKGRKRRAQAARVASTCMCVCMCVWSD